VRKDAPTPDLVAKLERERETRRINTIKWEEEQRRKDLQAQFESGDASASEGALVSEFLHSAEASQSADESVKTRLVQQSSKDGANDPYYRKATHLSTSIPNPKLVQQSKGFVDSKDYKAPNLSTLSSDQHRDVLKAYQQARTSPFQGIKPQIRSDSFVNNSNNRDNSSELDQRTAEKINYEMNGDGNAEPSQPQQQPNTQVGADLDAYNKFMQAKKKKLQEEQLKQ